MSFFDITASDISDLNDTDLRELVGRLCEAEIARQSLSILCVDWGGAQEAPDGGIDVRVDSRKDLLSQGFVPRKNTGFQVKKNSMSKAACTAEMQKDGQVKPVIAELADECGAYIIISGKDNCSGSMKENRLQGMKEAIKGLPNKSKLLLDFYGSDKLAQAVRRFPGVALWIRSRLGKPLSGWQAFGCWTSVKRDLDDEYLLGEEPCITDLSTTDKKGLPILEGIQLVRDKLRTKGRVVRIVGLSGVGKTRFAQALFEENVGENALSKSDVIYADLGEALTPSATDCIEYLITNNISAQIVLDNCPSDVHRTLQRRISRNDSDVSLLTIEYDIKEDQSEGTDVVQIEPSGEKLISSLVQKRFPQINQLNADKIAEFSGGNARVALALANRVEPDETLTKLSDDDLFLRLFQQRHGKSESLLESAELLSLVYSFNVARSEGNDELSVLAEVGELKRKDLHRNQAELLRRQLAQERGDWRAVLPHAIANKLAIMALQNITIEDINRVLFRKENFRLLKSCAHRLGYLHYSQEAKDLAKSWLAEDAPLHDISQCNMNCFSVFEYIAPIFPDVALDCIEKAFNQSPDFCSENNPNFLNIVRLLRKLAYDSEHFDRATYLILKFVEVRGVEKDLNNIIDYLKGLFSLYLSGTLTPPKQRQEFFRENISFDNPFQLKIAEELFDSIFNTSGWSSGLGFEFGARARGYGWEPKIYEDKLEWYTGFIEILMPLLSSKDPSLQKWVKSILTKYFNNLWTYAGCFELLTKIIREQIIYAPWPEMYLAIKNTLFFNEEKFQIDIKGKLQELEALTAPNDLKSQIEHYVLTNSWDLRYEYTGMGDEEETQSLRALEIGRQTFYNRGLLCELIPSFLQNTTDLQIPFGKGLAQESHDKKEIFSFLLDGVIINQSLMGNCYLLEGFLQGVYEQDASLARELQLQILGRPELKCFFIRLLATCPIDSEIVEHLIVLAKTGEIRAWDFSILASGMRHEPISDSDLVRLFYAIQELEEGGDQTIIHILNMRFFMFKRSNYQPNKEILLFGRQLIMNILLLPEEDIRRIFSFDLKQIVEICLEESTPISEVDLIIKYLCNYVDRNVGTNDSIDNIIVVLLENFPEKLLDKLFQEDNKHPIYWMFNGRLILKKLYINNFISIDRLLKWCGNDQLKMQLVVEYIFVFEVENERDLYPDERSILTPIRLNHHILTFLDIVENKKKIINVIYDQLLPRNWTGSQATIAEGRAEVFSSLLDHESIIVKELAQEAITRSTRYIEDIRKREVDWNFDQEQRFE